MNDYIANVRILVAGCGSIGRRHIRNLHDMGAENFILCDLDSERLKRASDGLEGAVCVDNLDDALCENPDVALICTPSSLHLDMALRLARRGVHLFIEKPLSHTIDGVDELIETVEKNMVTTMMGMCYRFHPVYRRLKEILIEKRLGTLYHINYHGGHYLPDWHPNEDYRKEYAARSELGGGVVLTSIHGLDNIRWLFGEVEEVKAFVDKVSSLEMDVEDLAVGIFRLKNGIYVSWQTDFLQRTNQHRMIIVGEMGTIRCDFLDGTIEIFLVDKGWEREDITFDINTMYVKELEYFFECVRKGIDTGIDVKEGFRTLRLAMEVKEKGWKENPGGIRWAVV